ncbi:class I SAM-dependent methyltransferase [Streptomyces sp. NPDC058623]|uniref:class I SAM-dependent methyltransferase n=1 Tax=Streptomyces sp. NPDC058623 TaxID=3346563 RepID=UPI003648DE4A
MDTWTTSHERVLARRSAGGWMFLLEAARDLRATGAVAPSSRRLGKLLTDRVREESGRALTVLEAGAGSGAITRVLLPLIGPGSRLDVVDSNPRFVGHLRHLVDAHPAPAGHHERVHVHQARIEHFDVPRRYDAIVSGLPFTNFDPAQVAAIMDRYLELLHPGGTLTYFAYRGTRLARSLLASRSEARRHREVEQVLAAYQRRHAVGRWTVWGNLPPADVWQLRAPAAVPAADSAAEGRLITSR